MTSRHRLVAYRGAGQGAGGNGLLLGALGMGAIAGAVLLRRIRTRLSTNALLVAASGAYAAALLALEGHGIAGTMAHVALDDAPSASR